MIRRLITAALVMMASFYPQASLAQTPAGSATSSVLEMVAGIEKTLTAVAEEMPEAKYEFVPTHGAFRGVRTFARQLKHAAAVQHLVAATILGERVTADMSDERGPDAVKTKAEVQEYLKQSFVALRRAAATVNDTNAFAPVKGPFGEASNTRVGLVMLAVSHSWNHYGQVVPYLRMNGIVPPRTQ